MNSIFHRRSIRKYTDQPIEAEKIELLLRAAMAAPSACNQQPWEYYVVKNQEMKDKLAQCSPYAHFANKADVIFIACYRRDCRVRPYANIDMSASVENLLLEADALGLGTCWMGIAPQEDRMKDVAEAVNLPRELHAFALISCGYPAEAPAPVDRYEAERVHFIL